MMYVNAHCSRKLLEKCQNYLRGHRSAQLKWILLEQQTNNNLITIMMIDY